MGAYIFTNKCVHIFEVNMLGTVYILKILIIFYYVYYKHFPHLIFIRNSVFDIFCTKEFKNVMWTYLLAFSCRAT